MFDCAFRSMYNGVAVDGMRQLGPAMLQTVSTLAGICGNDGLLTLLKDTRQTCVRALKRVVW